MQICKKEHHTSYLPARTGDLLQAENSAAYRIRHQTGSFSFGALDNVVFHCLHSFSYKCLACLILQPPLQEVMAKVLKPEALSTLLTGPHTFVRMEPPLPGLCLARLPHTLLRRG